MERPDSDRDSRPGDAVPAEGHSTANLVPNVARALLSYAEERGFPPERLCRGLGFTYEDLFRPEVLLSHQQIRSLILRADQAIGEPVLGLAVGARETPVSWGLPGLAMLTCETFGEAIAFVIAHQCAAGAMLDHVIVDHGREMQMDVRPRRFDLQIEPFLVAEDLGASVAVSRYLLGPSFNPLRMDFNFPRPADEDVYRRFFCCPVRFDAGINRMTFESHWFGVRMPGYDRINCTLLREQIDGLLTVPPGRQDLIESVSNRMRFDMEERATQKRLASAINISERTLRRRLSRQDTTFRDLRDDTRFEKARDLLANSRMTIAQIAEAVGYSDARAFRRAFKRWSGLLPAQFRKSR